MWFPVNGQYICRRSEAPGIGGLVRRGGGPMWRLTKPFSERRRPRKFFRFFETNRCGPPLPVVSMPITCESGHSEGLTTSPSRDLPRPTIDWVIGIRTNNSPPEQMGLVQPDELRLKLARNGVAMRGSYSYWRFSRRTAMDARLGRLMAWCLAGPYRGTEVRSRFSALFRIKLMSATFRRLLHSFYGVCFWFSLPLAVFTASGWLGLLSHGLAKTGAVHVPYAPFSKPSTG
jgi:hypothetical protein